MYATRYVEIYDRLMRNRRKDYAGEAADVATVVRERKPDATSLLDVACGTGLHLEHFVGLFDRVLGLDISEDMLRSAKEQIPGLAVQQADMRDFQLDARFDAITCMFAIPHLDSPAELDAMIACLVRHLNPGGVIVIEPWFEPTEFIPGYIATDVFRDGTRSIVRVSHSVLDPTRADRVLMQVHCIEADPASGLRDMTENAQMSLFTREHFETAFAKAGCVATYSERPGGKRLWIGSRRPATSPADDVAGDGHS
ncbi:methyltransferase domain-containing protein [Actinoplanes sp. NEAU-A12]|uniref:Methyltransferase domain-containing protein n=1 Tax=Actinoplanes sandaracinus TaxID=3045177 RepID=A0ABT6WZK0_9ACTN|nr:class I SAM-dependent methyltransferase [Actinoplanes sandaracinus]MDI6105181.1 methyltransferase domain-containing protein [Actinoplanes sandaracinus]